MPSRYRHQSQAPAVSEIIGGMAMVPWDDKKKVSLFTITHKSGWWFQRFFIVIPDRYLGRWSNLTDMFQRGLNQQKKHVSCICWRWCCGFIHLSWIPCPGLAVDCVQPAFFYSLVVRSFTPFFVVRAYHHPGLTRRVVCQLCGSWPSPTGS